MNLAFWMCASHCFSEGPKGRNEIPNWLFHCYDRAGENAATHRDENLGLKTLHAGVEIPHGGS
jgi:hypothetical protein